MSDEVIDLLAPFESAPAVTPEPELHALRCSRAELAAFLGPTARRINQLVEDGVLPPARRGRGAYNLREAVLAYGTYLSERSRGRLGDGDPLKAERLRQAKEAADKLALQNARARGELVEAAAVEREWGDMLRGVRAAMMSIPSRVASRLGTLTPADVAAIDREIRDVLSDTAEGR